MLDKKLSSMSIEELHKEVLELRKKQWQMKMQGRTGQSIRYSQFGKLRRDIARVYTLLNAKKK